ncbi:MAG: TrkH family potassium uptake protein [Candidatus Methanomethylophilaceae archaeon]
MVLTKRFHRWESTVIRLMGLLLLWTSLSMLLPLGAAMYFQEALEPFLFPILTCFAVSIPLVLLFRTSSNIRPVEGIFIVSFSWIMVMFVGAMPYILSGMGAVDACFESMSGFTTTGASIMADIESWPSSLLLWRSMTQWLGGAGIIMVFVTIFPILGIGGRNLFRNEGPSLDIHNFTVRIQEAAREFHVIYIALSAIMFVSLMLMGLEGMDAICITFSTISTGGFSPRAASIGYYDPLVQWLVIAFMFLGGTSFYLHYRAIYQRKPSYLKSTEFRWVLSIILLLTAATVAWRWSGFGVQDIGGFEALVRGSLFQTVSLFTSTGFATEDYTLYPAPIIVLLFLMAFVGASSGSTAGGIKTARIIIVARYFHNGLLKMLHPRAVMPVKFDAGSLNEDGLNSIILVVMSFVLVLVSSTVLLTLVGLTPDMALSASISSVSNIGPGVGYLGPYGSYASVDPLGKIVLTITMWAGRLEIMTVLVMLTPVFWKEMGRRGPKQI